MNISVEAPVLFLPLAEESEQCLMVDMGNLSLKNTLKPLPDTAEQVAVDEYIVTLTSFKVSRYASSNEPVNLSRTSFYTGCAFI